MYRDNSLIPKEAIRMATLGFLAEGDRSYSGLASEVRSFASRIVGPSLDLLAPSIELLKFEGLITPVSGRGMEDDAVLRLTDEGRVALENYLTASVRPGVSDLNKLVLAIKLRFIDLLGADKRGEQLEALEAMYEGERVRLLDLQQKEAKSGCLLDDWLSLEIELVVRRIDWCRSQRA